MVVITMPMAISHSPLEFKERVPTDLLSPVHRLPWRDLRRLKRNPGCNSRAGSWKLKFEISICGRRRAAPVGASRSGVFRVLRRRNNSQVLRRVVEEAIKIKSCASACR